MKKALWIPLLLVFTCIVPFYSQAQTSLEDKWKEVNRLIGIKNYDQTLPILADIKVIAMRNHDEGTWVKAFLAESLAKGNNVADDQVFENQEKHFKSNITASKGLRKAVLQNFYASYLLSNEFRYLSKSDNTFLQADAEKKKRIIDSVYNLSIQDREGLERSKIESWSAMLNDQKNISLSPTLYHFVTKDYLAFLMRDKKENKKKIDDLIKHLTALNKRNDYADAQANLRFITLDISYSNNLIFNDEVSKIIKSQKSNFNAYLLFLLAKRKFKIQQYEEAIKLLNQAKSDYPNSPWLANVNSLYKEIKKVDVGISHNKFAPTNQYVPIKVNGKNLDSLYIRVYNSTLKAKNPKFYSIKYDSISKITSIQAPLVYEEVIKLTDFNSYVPQISIYKLNPLPYGQYTIMVSNNRDFKDDGLYQDVSSSQIYISDQFFQASLTDEQDEYDLYSGILINRVTGEPFANKKLSLYDFPDSTKAKLIQNLKTDAKGQFTFKSIDKKEMYDLQDYYLAISGEDQLIELAEISHFPHEVYRDGEEDEEGDIQVLLLTDRAIYRPGQKLYFKSVVYNNHYQKGKVLADQKIEIRLFDANRRKIDSIFLKSNAYGSADSSFNLPSNTLAGNFSMEVFYKNQQIGNKYFRVEEYKRPTFKVQLEVNKETYTRKDTAIFKGKAEMLSGAPLIDAEVRIKIEVSGIGSRYSRSRNISTDTIFTDQKGNFEFKIPLMDSTYKGMENAFFRFTADVVNQTGELQTAMGSYQFSNKPWRIQVEADNRQEALRWSKLWVNTTNQNNQPLKFAGKVEIYKYGEPNVVIPANEKNIYSAITKHILSKEEYKKYFPKNIDPDFSFKNELQKTLIASYNFDTRDTNLVKIDSSLFTMGRYEVKAYSVFENDTIVGTSFVNLYDPVTKKTNKSEFLVSSLDSNSYFAGDLVKINFQTDEPDAKKLYLYKIKNGKKLDPEVLSWKNGAINYSFTLAKDEVNNNLSYVAVLVVNNKFESLNIYIPINRDDKYLNIKTHSFRDKISPGEKETWSFSISQKDKKMQTEVLATMYDSALDDFSSNAFPYSFALRYPYYGSPNFYNWYSTFHEKSNPRDIFQSMDAFHYLDNELPVVFNYGLWSQMISFSEPAVYDMMSRRSVIEEVVVADAAKQSLTGSVAGVAIRGNAGAAGDAQTPLYVMDGEVISAAQFNSLNKDNIAEFKVLKGNEATATYGSRAANGVIIVLTKDYKKAEDQLNQVQARKKLQETAFFFPKLYSDEQGTVRFEFDSPEALTKWKLLLFAHDKELNAGSATFYSQTQKQLMVRPNLPRYFREGDEILIKAQVQNLSKEIQKGNARIELIDPETNSNISNKFMEGGLTIPFQVDPQNNGTVGWKLRIPADIHSVQVKVIAATDTHSDGEIVELPILSDKVLITDTEKILLKAKQEKTYQIKIGGKDNIQAKVQVQSNPILEIISALDYLKNYPYECTEQSASKWFGLKVLQYMEKHYPAISNYFKSIDSKEMKGNLESNAALKDIKLEEMPWIRQIENDQEKLKQLAKLFQSDITSELLEIEKKIMDNQLSSGGFSWFKGGRVDTYMSIRILEVFGKVLQLDKSLIEPSLMQKSKNLIDFLDKDTVVFNPKSGAYMALNYLHARHYWTAYKTIPKDNLSKLKPRLLNTPLLSASGSAGDAAKAWVVNLLYGTGKEATEIRNRLQQEMITDEDKGIYWRSNDNKYNNVSLQSYMVEAYKLNDPSKLMGITQYLYYKKNANHWYSTWMTVDAIYALLLANNPADFVLVNNISLKVDQQDVKLDDVVLGQVSKVWGKEELSTNKNIAVTNNNDRTVYGGIYHQYFVPAADVKQTTNELAVSKKYMIERNGKWEEAKEVRLGDKIKVEITVIADKNLNYVHLKDSRPSGVEPVYQASGYQWRRGYYFTLKDASTNYFFDYLAKGKHTFSYEIKANNVGTFNSGITTIDCMYDPAVNARSENLEVKIKE